MRALEEAKKEEEEWEEQFSENRIKGSYSRGRALRVAEERIRGCRIET